MHEVMRWHVLYEQINAKDDYIMTWRCGIVAWIEKLDNQLQIFKNR